MSEEGSIRDREQDRDWLILNEDSPREIEEHAMTDVTPHPKEAQLKTGRPRKYRRKVAGPKQWQALRSEKGDACRLAGNTELGDRQEPVVVEVGDRHEGIRECAEDAPTSVDDESLRNVRATASLYREDVTWLLDERERLLSENAQLIASTTQPLAAPESPAGSDHRAVVREEAGEDMLRGHVGEIQHGVEMLRHWLGMIVALGSREVGRSFRGVVTTGSDDLLTATTSASSADADSKKGPA